ncbi:MAG: GldG family protein [Patescibacteria group bacterium]|nr:GldG family protein [Patescibacteria group bacterium]
MNFKKILDKSNLGLTIVIVFGILVMVNFFSYNIFYRFDLTQNKDYSISGVSKKTVASLQDVVNIKAYFSSNLPAQYLNLKQEVGDILEEYASYAGGKVKIEFIDPKNDQATEQELYLAGIPQLQFNVLEKDKYQVVNGYMGLAIKYGDKHEAIPVVGDTRDLEYQLTSAIKKVTNNQVASIGFWQGNGAASMTNGAATIAQKLSEIYNVSAVDFSAEKKIPADLDGLIIMGAKEKFTDEELKAIDAFLINGGALAIFANGVNVEQGLKASKNDVGLNKILEAYGVKLNNNLVLDVNNGMASFSQGFVTFTTDYPYWPKVVKSGFDQNNAAVAKLESLVLPWASSVDVLVDRSKDLTVSYLAATTNRAAVVADNFNLSPQAQIKNGTAGKYNLAVSLVGKFTSAFANQASSAPGGKPGHLILVGDSDFASDGFLRNYPDNLLFFENVIDSVSLGDELITIRSKGVTERPIKEVSEAVKAGIRYANIFGLTVIVILFGLARYFLRRRTKLADRV